MLTVTGGNSFSPPPPRPLSSPALMIALPLKRGWLLNMRLLDRGPFPILKFIACIQLPPLLKNLSLLDFWGNWASVLRLKIPLETMKNFTIWSQSWNWVIKRSLMFQSVQDPKYKASERVVNDIIYQDVTAFIHEIALAVFYSQGSRWDIFHQIYVIFFIHLLVHLLE